MIEVHAPSSLDENPFENVVLILGKPKSPSLFVPLQTYDKDDRKVLGIRFCTYGM